MSMGGGGLGEPLVAELRAEIGDFVSKMDTAKAKFSDSTKTMQDDAEKASGGIVERMGGIGPALTKTLLPAAAAVGAVALKLGNEWNSATKEMEVQTGATGGVLDKLMGDVQAVAGTVKGSVGEISNTVSDLAAKTNLVGPPLETLTKRIMELKELGIQISGTQVAATFGGWGVAADQMANSLDRVYKVGQSSGQGFQVIMDRLNDLRPVLQGLGYNFDQSSVLVAKLSDTMVPGLRKALTEITKAHGDVAKEQKAAESAQKSYDAAVRASGAGSTEAKEAADKLAEANTKLSMATSAPKKAFEDLIASIKNAKTDEDAMALGMDAFGSKSGPAFVAAIRAGKLNIDELTKGVEANKNTIHGAADAHRTFSDRLKMWTESMKAWAAPYAQIMAPIAGAVGMIGPALVSYQKVVEFLGKIKAARAAATAATAASIPVEAAGAAANVTAGASAATASGGFFALASGVWAAIAPLLPIIATLALVAGAAYLLYKNWDEVWGFIKKITGAAVGFVKENLDLFIGAVSGPIRPLLLLARHWDEVWGGIKDTVGTVKDFVVDTVEAIIHAIGRMKSALSDIPGMGILGAGLGAVGLLGFDVGGTVPGYMGQPRLAVVHGGEQISPPGHPNPGSSGGGGVNFHMTVNVGGGSGVIGSADAIGAHIAPAVQQALLRIGGRNTGLGFAG